MYLPPRPMMEIPELKSARLRFRAHRKEDFENCAALWSDPRVIQFIGGQPFTAQQTWARLLNYTGHWAHLGFGYWLVEDLATGRFVGEVGFADYRRQIEPPIIGTPESGWVISPDFQGKGYATEALQTILEWGDVNFTSNRTVCIISPGNAQSIRVAEKCGYRETRKAIYQGSQILMFSR